MRVDTDDRLTAEWDTYVDRHPDASPYHRREWHRIFGEALGYPGFLLMAQDSAGSTRGVLPLYLVSTPWRRRLVAVPFRDRGGPLWDDADAFDALLKGAKLVLGECNARTMVLKTLHPFPADCMHHGLRRVDHWIHSVLDLRDVSEDSLWNRIGAKTRNMIRQARNQSLEIRHAGTGPDAARRWHRLHLQTQKRLGMPPFPERFFTRMLEALGPSHHLAYLEILHAGDPCAASLLLLHGETCVYGYAASNADGQRFRANDLLLFESIRFALKRGMRRFDFGADSPLQQSLLFFKRKWGAVQAKIPCYSLGGDFEPADSSARRYALARLVFKRSPLGLLATVGGRLTRYLG